MRKIVTIGGGAFRTGGTLAIDREVVRLTGKKNPTALFVPTASSDDLGYQECFHAIYGKKLNCQTDVLCLIQKNPSYKETRNKILSADLIYVGGGNTLKMMRRWRWLGVDKLLRQASQRGSVLAGLSAGCICWYRYGHSDSMAYYHPKKWDYVRVKGMGMISALGCPHYNGEKRDKNFSAMIKKVGGIGIAIDDHCAIEYVGQSYRVITSKKGARAYKVYRIKDKVVMENIAQKKEFTSLRMLIKK